MSMSWQALAVLDRVGVKASVLFGSGMVLV